MFTEYPYCIQYIPISTSQFLIKCSILTVSLLSIYKKMQKNLASERKRTPSSKLDTMMTQPLPRGGGPPTLPIQPPVSYTHLTLPTILRV